MLMETTQQCFKMSWMMNGLMTEQMHQKNAKAFDEIETYQQHSNVGTTGNVAERTKNRAKVIESKEMAFNFSEYMELRNVYS